jgi:hypothetical protein
MATAIVHVVGDPTVDWLNPSLDVDPGTGPYFYQRSQNAPEVRLSAQAGGAALLTQFLRRLLPGPRATVLGVSLPDACLYDPLNPCITRAWTTWKRQPGPKDRSAFRISDWGRTEHNDWEYTLDGIEGLPDLLVIEDSGLGFRSRPESWPESLGREPAAEKPGAVLLKLALYADRTLEQLPVLDALVAGGLGDRTTVITSLSDLRACAVRIGTSLSWERLFEETVGAVFSPACPFARDGKLLVHQVLVTINASGAALVTGDECALVFDRSGQEGDFERQYAGAMMGYNTAVLGALAAAWVEKPTGTDWLNAARNGVGLARELLYGGYHVDEQSHLAFPMDRLISALAADPAGDTPHRSKAAWNLGRFVDSRHRSMAQTEAQDLKAGGAAEMVETRARSTVHAECHPWTILEEELRHHAGDSLSETALYHEVCRCAAAIVRVGPDRAPGLHNVPVETVGFWRSADRHEIEGVRSVNNAMRDYLEIKRPETPLAIAVFGPPGSGKSFAIKEIAKGLGIAKDAQLTFNLSQFETADELAAAFHQIRDLHFKGATPLVFWDEFDTPCEKTPLGWLRHFLAPIQDGLCIDRGAVHPTGGGIYVFAGGTCKSFREFSRVTGPEDRAAKKPDFVSRLRAYIDIKGPNGDPNSIEDPLWMVRRAFLLNSFLARLAGHLKKKEGFSIGDPVLRAFLRTAVYYHGARSMESLIRTSALKGKGTFELSGLPPQHLMRMHVNADDFLALTRSGYREMLRIGVTGHIGLDPAKMGALTEGIERAVRLIEARFPDRTLTVFSPLAKGADRLVAREVLASEDARLIAVLPVPAEDYINDFGATDDHRVDYDGAELRQEFRHLIEHRAIETIVMTPSATRNEAYERVGFFAAGHCDVMVAVWDGEGSQGQGGTGDIVRRAAELGKPIIHVWAGNYKPDPARRTDVGSAHGRIRACWAPGSTDIDSLLWEGDCVKAKATRGGTP